jgi:GT2 family glycosyltransferase
LREFLVTVVVPTLAAGENLLACLSALDRQTFSDFEVIVVDNSGQGLVRRHGAAARILEEKSNAGFGAAINHAVAVSRSRYVATINDDAVAHAGWLAALVEAMESRPRAGMCASQVRLYGSDLLDSAGMVVAADGSSKQRGHLEPAREYGRPGEALLPSGAAAIYRRSALEQTGGFDEGFFLYCEDTDLGLRLRWAGWSCYYAPEAVVEHRYSRSAGRASPLKAYLVERNRLFTILKNYPATDLTRAFLASTARYVWHLVYLARGRGKAAEFHAAGHGGWRLGMYVIRAHWAALISWRSLMAKRSAVRRSARLSSSEFGALLRAHSIPLKLVAQL